MCPECCRKKKTVRRCIKDKVILYSSYSAPIKIAPIECTLYSYRKYSAQLIYYLAFF